MLVALQFPFTDVRPFLQGDTGLVSAPAWGNADPARDFVRGIGPIRPRRKGALTEWPEEDAFCRVSSAVRFDPAYHATTEPELAPLRLRRYCAFRRFMADGRFSEGSVVARLEFGFGYRARKEAPRDLTPEECLAVVLSTLNLQVQLRTNGAARDVSLLGARNLFDGLYLRSSSRRKPVPSPIPSQTWWFRAGMPLALVEFRAAQWPPTFPAQARCVPGLRDQGIDLAYHRIQAEGLMVGVWLVALRPGTERSELLRRLRINLFRLHAERQSIAEALRLVRQKKIGADKGSSDNLQLFLRDAINLLNQTSRDGLPLSEILKASAEAENLAQPGERERLLRELEKIRPGIQRKVKDYLNEQPTEPPEQAGQFNTAMNNKKVFISHSSQDKPFVRRLVQELQRHNLKVWFDEGEIQVGGSIPGGISKSLDDSDYFIVVLSKAAVASDWVQRELNAALMGEISRKDIVVLPVLAEDCEVPYMLRDRLYADFRADFNTGLNRLLAVLGQEGETAAQVVTTTHDLQGKARIIAPAPCPTALAALSLADLRRRMTKRMDRNEIGVIWFDVLDAKMDDDMPGKAKTECVIELLDRSRNRNKLPEVIAAVCESRSDLAHP